MVYSFLAPFLLKLYGVNILLRRDVVVPNCPHSELLLEVTTL